MKRFYFKNLIKHSVYVLLLLVATTLKAQIGIGTVTPAASAALDITSTTQGMLTPRMTTVQRQAITSPADGLIVYDTDLKSFYHYITSTASWSALSSEANGRLNYKMIKSTDVLATVLAAELAAGGGTKYLLNTNTLYEINGTVNVNLPIDLNDAYITGEDTNEDKLVKATGILFQSAAGGSIRNLTLIATAGSVFSLSGTAAKYLIFRDSLVVTSASVGSISGYGLVFVSIVQFAANTTGITYNNIGQLLISNVGWFGNNTGTYETLTGTFTLVEKQGGFSSVNGTAIGFDVSANPTITADAVLESVVFTGTLSTGLYVKPYTVGTYTGYNFNNNWNVRSAGIPTETDASAAGEFTFDYPVGSGAITNFNSNPAGTTPTSINKVQGVSASSNLFRFSTGGVSNRLVYLGKKKRLFDISGSISFQIPASGIYIIYITKNGSTTGLTQYKIYGRSTVANDILVLPLNALAELVTNDYIEVYAQRYSGTSNSENIITPNLTLVVR